jgi:dTDP-4-dehydrorhamnose reductase
MTEGRRVLIIGASGFIGQYLMDSLLEDKVAVMGTYCKSFRDDLVHLDLLNQNSIASLLAKFNPTYVLFLAGTKNVDLCEKNPEHAISLNVDCVRAYLTACSNTGWFPKTVYFSTDYVFDGLRGHYRREDEPSPKTLYGVTNFLAEHLILKSDVPAIVLRVSAVMGLKGGFFSWIYNSLGEGKKIELFDNTFFSPTSVGRLCSFIKELIATPEAFKEKAIHHLSDGYRLTRYEFGKIISSRMGKNQGLVVPDFADLSQNLFQADLSLLPDDLSSFKDSLSWDEMENIY